MKTNIRLVFSTQTRTPSELDAIGEKLESSDESLAADIFRQGLLFYRDYDSFVSSLDDQYIIPECLKDIEAFEITDIIKVVDELFNTTNELINSFESIRNKIDEILEHVDSIETDLNADEDSFDRDDTKHTLAKIVDLAADIYKLGEADV